MVTWTNLDSQLLSLTGSINVIAYTNVNLAELLSCAMLTNSLRTGITFYLIYYLQSILNVTYSGLGSPSIHISIPTYSNFGWSLSQL